MSDLNNNQENQGGFTPNPIPSQGIPPQGIPPQGIPPQGTPQQEIPPQFAQPEQPQPQQQQMYQQQPQQQMYQQPPLQPQQQTYYPQGQQVQPQYAYAGAPIAPIKINKKLIIIAGAAISGLLLLLILISAISGPSGEAKVALNYVKNQGNAFSSYSFAGAGVKIDYKVVAQNKSRSLYVVDVSMKASAFGESMSGGYFVVVQVDGKNARERNSYSYGDFSFWGNDSRADVLKDAKDFIE
ncbi:MAG: hypothetical protein FWG44_00455 [Oscillospiraceae bacterium]|nr:hypothetical protein [Oscillospiraceae bacterium]